MGLANFQQLWDAIASQKHATEVFLRYLADGGNIDTKHPETGLPILHYAIEMADSALVQALLKAGADTQIRNALKQTPLHRAVDIDIDGVQQRTGNLANVDFAMTRLVLKAGGDLSAKDKDGKMPRDWVAGYGQDVLNRFDKLTAELANRK